MNTCLRSTLNFGDLEDNKHTKSIKGDFLKLLTVLDLENGVLSMIKG